MDDLHARSSSSAARGRRHDTRRAGGGRTTAPSAPPMHRACADGHEPARGPDVAKRYGPVVALRVRRPRRRARRGARAAGRERRGQEHARQDPHRRDPRGRGTITVDGKAVRVSLAGAGGADRARARLPGSGARARPDGRAEPAAHRARTSRPCGAARRRWTSTSTSPSMAGDLPLPLLRMLDLARALAHDPQLLMLDEITAALPSDLAERVFAVMRRLARARSLGPLHLAPPGRGDRRRATARPCCATAARRRRSCRGRAARSRSSS